MELKRHPSAIHRNHLQKQQPNIPCVLLSWDRIYSILLLPSIKKPTLYEVGFLVGDDWLFSYLASQPPVLPTTIYFPKQYHHVLLCIDTLFCIDVLQVHARPSN